MVKVNGTNQNSRYESGKKLVEVNAANQNSRYEKNGEKSMVVNNIKH